MERVSQKKTYLDERVGYLMTAGNESKWERVEPKK